jgi:hypothetical protein
MALKLMSSSLVTSIGPENCYVFAILAILCEQYQSGMLSNIISFG